jgi:hypothetical protein
MEKEKLEKINYISNIVIATVAIAGFIYAIFSNRETSDTLKTITNTFETYTEPLLVFNDYDYLAYKGDLPSCDNLPIGINFSYKNASNFAVKFTRDSLRIKYNNQIFWGSDTSNE